MKNESAFPKIDAPSLFTTGGLTKRELFAAMAMQGFISSLTLDVGSIPRMKMVCGVSLRYADALIAELERTNQGESG